MGKGLNKYPPDEWSSIWGSTSPAPGPGRLTETRLPARSRPSAGSDDRAASANRTIATYALTSTPRNLPSPKRLLAQATELVAAFDAKDRPLQGLKRRALLVSQQLAHL